MIYKKLAFGLLAAVAIAAPAAAQADQGQTSIQKVQSQNAAVNHSIAVTDTDLKNQQAQFEHDGFYDYDSQGQLSVQDAATSNASVDGSIAVTDTDLNNQQVQIDDAYAHPLLPF